jgi:iron complex outermembrane receptor protein
MGQQRRRRICAFAVAAILAAHGSGVRAQASLDATDLSAMSLAQLANVDVMAVARRAEPLSAAPAAVFVITAEDIRRSGARNIAEVLRLAPNLEVAQLNATSWTITSRGFNSPESANKLLVLIDGRSVYSPLGGTVYWQAIDVPVATISRIEVVSGPGGALFGANDVNGVISITTLSSRDTQGVTAVATGGSTESTAFAAFGGAFGQTGTFRVSANGFRRDPTQAATPGQAFNDRWQGGQLDFRADAASGPDEFWLEGDLYENDPVSDPFINKAWGGSLTGHVIHPLEDGGSLRALLYYDNQEQASSALNDRLDTFDLQVQHKIVPIGDHTVTYGGEARVWRDDLHTTGTFFFAQPTTLIGLGNLFGQDQWRITQDLEATIGFKLEYNSFSGFDYLPNVRLGWQATPSSLFWAAISRSVRTPSKIDRDLQATGILVPSPHFESEDVVAYEVGYRGQLEDDILISLSAFYNDYSRLRTDPFANGVSFPIMLSNGLEGHTYGFEAWGTWQPTSWWRLAPGFNLLRKDFRLMPGATDFSQYQSVGEDPNWQAQLRSEMQLGKDWELDLTLRGIGAVKRDWSTGYFDIVPAYAEMDGRIGWRFSDGWELALAGRNLLHSRHIEVNDLSTQPERYIPRSVYVSLRARI